MINMIKSVLSRPQRPLLLPHRFWPCGSTPRLRWAVALLMAIASGVGAAAGCSGRRDESPQLGEVRGVVSLNGQPLARAKVLFVPSKRGRSSSGFTDDTGSYSLDYGLKQPGAVVGRHIVEIRTGGEGRDKDGTFVETPERLPDKYHAKSQLTATVSPGSNDIDFKLGSQPTAKP
jgi:hypothetical protein